MNRFKIFKVSKISLFKYTKTNNNILNNIELKYNRFMA